MNREIKFRAWDSINNKWLLGYDYPNLGGFSMFGEVMAFGEYSNMLSSFDIKDWNKIKLMQFTGLKDKNGKEIYDGDIVKWNNRYGKELKSKVFFDEKLFCPMVLEPVIGFESLYKSEASLFHCSKLCEVIGNIHENRELL